MFGEGLANTDWQPNGGALAQETGGLLSGGLGALGMLGTGGMPLPSITGGHASGRSDATNTSPVTVGGSPFVVGDGNRTSAEAGVGVDWTMIAIAFAAVAIAIVLVRR